MHDYDYNDSMEFLAKRIVLNIFQFVIQKTSMAMELIGYYNSPTERARHYLDSTKHFHIRPFANSR